ncbi:MAG TPA: alpha-amylase family protein [Pyrinomonadaceae bacterium]|nr:alpha-amylase family protein [Pyrinomonadaceae bacterium]
MFILNLQKICGLVGLLLVTSAAAFANPEVTVSLNRSRVQRGERVEVTVQAASRQVRAVLLTPTVGTRDLALKPVADQQGMYHGEVALTGEAPQGLYVVHVFAGEISNPTAVGKASFLLGRLVNDFFVAPYIDREKPAQDVDAYLKAFRRVGGNFLIAHNLISPTKAYYPSRICKTDVLSGSVNDLVELVLSRADKDGFGVLLSVSWDMTRQSPFQDRMQEIKAIAKEMYDLYKHHPSLAGFYSYQEGSGTYFVPYVREFSQYIKSLDSKLLTACAPHVDDPLLAGYLSTVSELDVIIYQAGVMASYRTDNRKKYPPRRVKDFCSLGAGARRLQNKIAINHVELFGYLENRLNPQTAATTYENIYTQILSAATVTDSDGISFFTYHAHVYEALKKHKQVERSDQAVVDGVRAFDLISSRISRKRNPLAVYFPYSDWIIERWPNYFLPALDAFRVLGIPVDILPYAPPLEESTYPFYPFHMNEDVLARLLIERTLLVLPNVSGFQQTDSDLIKSFVEQGGVVIAFGPQIPMGRSYERGEFVGADETAGMSSHTAIGVKEAVGGRVKIGSRFALTKTQLPGWTINKARVIATFEDNSAAIIANRFGKGIVVSIFPDAPTAVRDFPDLVRDVIGYALSSSGDELVVDIVGTNENMDMAVGKTAVGFTVALANHSLSNVQVVIRPTKSYGDRGGEWFDLVAGNKVPSAASDRSLKLTIEGTGFRALEFR